MTRQRIAAAFIVIVLVAVAIAALSGDEDPPNDALVLIVTADGDGHLDGLPLAIDGGYPLGGLDRLAEAIETERGYFPDAVVMSGGGDIGSFPDATALQMATALQGLSYDAIAPGAPEFEICETWPAEAPRVISANVDHALVADSFLTVERNGVTWGITSVTAAEATAPCRDSQVRDPEGSLLTLFQRYPRVDSWVVVSYLGVDSVELAIALADRDAPVSAVISAGARREASALPWEPPSGRPIVVMDAGREWRDLLVLRLEANGEGLISYEGTRRVPLDF